MQNNPENNSGWENKSEESGLNPECVNRIKDLTARVVSDYKLLARENGKMIDPDDFLFEIREKIRELYQNEDIKPEVALDDEDDDYSGVMEISHEN